MDERTDAELLLAARTDRDAFEELYRRHNAAVIGFAIRRSRKPEEVVDLTGAVWLEVLASLHRFDPALGDPIAWIIGIAANLCAAERRRRAREGELLRRLNGRRALSEDDHLRIEQALDAAAIVPDLMRALAALPGAERVAAEMVFVDGLTPSEAANALGVEAPTLRMRLARARRKLRAAAPDAREPAVPMIEEVR